MSDDKRAFVAPCRTLCREDARQRKHDPWEVFNALRWRVRAGTQWRSMPNRFPPWAAVHQQPQRWIAAGAIEALVYDLPRCSGLADVDAEDGAARRPHPSAVVRDGTVLQSTPESGSRAGYNGHERKKGGELHLAGRHVRPPVRAPRHAGGTVELASVDQGDTGADMAADAAAQGITLEVVKLPEAKRGFVLLPRR